MYRIREEKVRRSTALGAPDLREQPSHDLQARGAWSAAARDQASPSPTEERGTMTLPLPPAVTRLAEPDEPTPAPLGGGEDGRPVPPGSRRSGNSSCAIPGAQKAARASSVNHVTPRQVQPTTAPSAANRRGRHRTPPPASAGDDGTLRGKLQTYDRIPVRPTQAGAGPD
jgi:hypothetical protein